MKKILSLILAGLMTVSCAAFVAADDAAVEATTDPVQDYAIEFLSNCGVFKGGEGLTNEDLIQRYQMALFVSRISTGWVDDATWEDGTANDATFKDIDTEPANKYLGALSYANQNGIIEGYTANTFAPYASITYRDALTMVVRTLGYKGLSYPWGNIEKAVELGLTEGVDAAYTDELTRGEVAVIIYNAMFAKNSKGETLAKSIFGYDFGFQNIVVVSTDEYTTVTNKDGVKQYAPAGYVGFSAIDETGKIDSKVYFVKSEELGLSGHEEEQAVGAIYVALFEIDGDYVQMLDSASTLIKTVFNNGVTDDKGEKYATMPIAAELANNYALVKEYTAANILTYTYDDLKVYGFDTVDVVDVDGNALLVGIDKADNIVYYYGDCSKTTHTDHKCGWEIEWYYNSSLERYYRYVVDDTNDTVDKDGKATISTDAGSNYNAANVYVDWMSDAEFTEWYNKIIKKVIATNDELVLLEAAASTMNSGKAPYAKLALFNNDADDAADIAIYKDYAIGIFTYDAVNHKCTTNAGGVNHAAGVVMPRYEITDLEGNEQYAAFVEAGHEAHDTDKNAGFAWVTVDPSVTTFKAEEATKGEVVVYDFNKTTGEIEIVKHITSGTNDDADSKIITGVLQAYSTKNKTVTIDGTVYPIDYDGLTGDVYAMANTETAARKAIGAILDAQYMQYITAVVCDGYVVDTDLRGSDTDAIVVLGYAGITSDGYIAVYGYKTDSLKLEVIKVNSYNGWKKGDYRYYPENADEDAAFAFGSLYTIKSYDTESNSYGVYTENVETVLENAVPVRITFENGYRVVQPMVLTAERINNVRPANYRYTWETEKDSNKKDVAATIAAMTAADKYVIVDNDEIFVYDGIVKEENDYAVEGLMVASKLDASTVVIYTLENLDSNPDFFPAAITYEADVFGGRTTTNNIAGFADNAYDIGYVVYEKANGIVLDAAYDEAISGTYLLGSTMSEVTVFNLLTGTRDTVIASSNIDLNAGCLYKTYGNQILQQIDLPNNVDDNGTDFENGHNFISAIANSYKSKDLKYADYIVAHTDTLTKATLTKVDLAEVLGLIDIDGVPTTFGKAEDATGTEKAIANKLIHDDFAKKIFTWADNFEWDWYVDNTALELTALSELSDKTTYKADLVYEVATGKVVIYIYAGDDDNDGKADGIITDAKTESFGGTIYEAKSETAWYTDTDLNKWRGAADKGFQNIVAKWTVKDGNTNRYFTVALDYEVEVTYGDELCKDIDKIELVKIGARIVEIALADSSKAWSATDNKWSAKALEACESGLHNLLDQEDIGFGHCNDLTDELMATWAGNVIESVAGQDMTAVLNGTVIEPEDVTILATTDCGIVHGITFDLTDAPIDVTSAVVGTTGLDIILKLGANTNSNYAKIEVKLVFDKLTLNDTIVSEDDLTGLLTDDTTFSSDFAKVDFALDTPVVDGANKVTLIG